MLSTESIEQAWKVWDQERNVAWQDVVRAPRGRAHVCHRAAELIAALRIIEGMARAHGAQVVASMPEH